MPQIASGLGARAAGASQIASGFGAGVAELWQIASGLLAGVAEVPRTAAGSYAGGAEVSRMASRFPAGVAEVRRMASRFGGWAGAGARTRAENAGIRIFLSRNAGLRLHMSARGAGSRVRRSAAHSFRIESRVRRSVAHSVRLASRGGSVRPVGQKSVCTNQARRARSEQRKGSASGNTDMAALTENRLAKTRRAARARSDETRPRPAPEARH